MLMARATSDVTVRSVEPFPEVRQGDDLAETITLALTAAGMQLVDGDAVVVASKVVSIAERRHINLAAIAPGREAIRLATATGKPPALVQAILDESTSHRLATERGPIIATHRLGHELTSAGVDRAGHDSAWLLPVDPDASARALRDQLNEATGARVAVVIADSDGRSDRRGSTVLAIGAAGINPLRVTTHISNDGSTKRQEETLVDLVAAAAGLILGQRGRGAPIAIVRGLAYDRGDEGLAAILHKAPRP
jgi:coenzyme F420-0:L-glutamate ligase/coenzyme F420-1:gamma-L-glutamate ligase